MKRAMALLLVLAVLLSIGIPEQGVALQSAESREWFYIDYLRDAPFTGGTAIEMLGDMDRELITLERTDGHGYYSPLMYYAPLTDQLDMSVYDVLNFKGRGSWKMSGSAAVVSSVYEAAEYAMYRIMSGTGYVQTSGSWGGVYALAFKPNTNMRYSKDDTSALFLELYEFISAYFPHYFHLGASVKYNTADLNINEYTLMLGHSVKGKPDMNWKEEYNEAASIAVALDSGDNNQKLKNIHDYLAKTVEYNSRDMYNPLNQEAYSALITKKSVCNGIALATSMLSFRMDMDVPYMCGWAGEPHAWNLSLLEYPSSKLLVDVTWAGSANQAWKTGNVSYNWFNKPLSGFSGTRRWSPYYESYIDYVHGRKGSLNPGMIFGKMSQPDPTPPPKTGKPRITKHSKLTHSVKKGKKITLKITAKNTGIRGKLTYQWQKSKKKSGFKNIKGKAAKKRSYKPSTKKKSRMFYRCRVTHTAGNGKKSRNSKVFKVTVRRK
ncbi:MAG: hypothetical protein FWH04_08980 [Oscillospiraceae bacterium]|nr:hypothetical protein [Oscillospiraceae bacterium]